MTPLQPRTGPFTPTGEKELSLRGVQRGAIPAFGQLAYHNGLPTRAQSACVPGPLGGPAPARPGSRDAPNEPVRRMS